VPVSLDRLIESKLLVQANSGGGKSWAVRYLLEQTHGRVQHIVLDREGEFATLREHYAYLLVGREGDVAADVRARSCSRGSCSSSGLSAVIDLSEMSLGQQKEYVATFVDAINHLPRALWKDCLIVIDEAHLFAPEKGKGDRRSPARRSRSCSRRDGSAATAWCSRRSGSRSSTRTSRPSASTR
jgi:DNA helicase HerA-like ATPase